VNVFTARIVEQDIPAPPKPVRAPRQSALPAGWALFAALVGPAVAAFCIAIEPAPANPSAPEPLIGTVLALAYLTATIGAAVLASQRRVGALTWAWIVGALSVAMTISCPLSGHHDSIGMWWGAQFLVSGAAWAVAAGARYSFRHRTAV
jgi:hypothetical protein